MKAYTLKDRLFRKQNLIPMWIFFFAFLLRFLYIYLQKNTIFNDCLVLDMEYYHLWAVRIVGGDWLGGKEVFEMTPLYSYLLALFYRFVTMDFFAVKLLQITAGSVSCVLVYRITKDVVGSAWAGLLGGMMAAAYGVFIFFDGMIMKEFLAVFFVLLMTLFLLRSEKGGTLSPFLGGLFLGLAALVRENIILIVPIIPLWLFISGKDEGKRPKALQGAAFLLGAVIVIMPVTLRNLYVSGELVPITSGGGEVFYIGNNPDADGMYSPPPFVRPTPFLEHEDFRQKAMEITGKRLSKDGGLELLVQTGP